MTKEEAIQELQNCKGLIQQDGQDYLDERDIPLLDMAIESLSVDAEPKWSCTANFVAEQLNKLEDMTVNEKLKLIQDLLGVEFKEENLNYEHATLVDIKEPLKVAVVRCKDCKWQKFIDWGMGDCLHPKGSRHIAYDNHYCSYGERR